MKITLYLFMLPFAVIGFLVFSFTAFAFYGVIISKELTIVQDSDGMRHIISSSRAAAHNKDCYYFGKGKSKQSQKKRQKADASPEPYPDYQELLNQAKREAKEFND